MNTRWHDLIIDRLPDGGIHLEQHSGVDDPNVIHLHPAQLRYIAEIFGLIAPNYPADELTARLARQLGSILIELEEECHRSHRLGLTFTKLDAFVSSIPEAFFPHDLWDDDNRSESDADDTKPIYPCSAIEQAKKRQPSAIPETGEQLGLAV